MFVRTHRLLLTFLKHYGKSEKTYQERIGLKKKLLFGHPSDLSIKFESSFGALKDYPVIPQQIQTIEGCDVLMS